jgi:hypothetical protein
MSRNVLNKITFSNIDPEIKRKAIKDIHMMRWYLEYSERTCYNIEAENLTDCFAFNKSVLGAKFWFDLSLQLDNN